MPPADAEVDATFMRRALRLAMNGRGKVEPNPMVGCVLVKDDQVIGEGYHEQFGGPHAEPNALAACLAAGASPAGGTAYVTLEPCCHTDKKTPPCVPRLIEAKIARVVVGCVDPNPQVSDRGLAMLRAAGIEVAGPVLEAEAKQLIAPFLARVKHGRPYVTLKWAQTADAKIAGPAGRRLRITNPTSAKIVHELRARCDAILVGVNTVLADDPMLIARGIDSPRPLLRVVLDSRLRTPPSSQLVRTARLYPVAIYGARRAGITNVDRLCDVFFDLGVPVFDLTPGDDGHLSLVAVLGALDVGITHLLVEPGPTLARSFFRDGLADRLWVFRSPRRADDNTAPAAAPVPEGFVVTGEIDLDGDRLTEYLNPASDVFFGPFPSADFVRLAGSRDKG